MLVADNYHLEAGGLGDWLNVVRLHCGVCRLRRTTLEEQRGRCDTVARVVFEQLHRRHHAGNLSGVCSLAPSLEGVHHLCADVEL